MPRKRPILALLAALLLPAFARAADSVFVEGAFNGQWNIDKTTTLTIDQILPRSNGPALINSLGDPNFNATSCPPATEKAEYYRAIDQDGALLYACTNGNGLVGLGRDTVQGQLELFSFRLDPISTGPAAKFAITGVSNIDGAFAGTGTYLGGGIANPLSQVPADQVMLLSVTPSSGAKLQAGSVVPFSATVSYKMSGHLQGTVRLIVTNGQQTVGSSPEVNVAVTDPEQQSLLQIPPTAVPPAGALTLRAEMRLASGAVVASSIAVSFRIFSLQGPALEVAPASVSVTVQQGAAAEVRLLRLSNQSDQDIAYAAETKTANHGAWLAVGAGGSVAAFTGTAIAVTVDPMGLAAGTYLGEILVSSQQPAANLTVPVVLTVAPNQPSLLLSRTGLTFFASPGVGTVPPQSFQVRNAGAGAINWTAKASVLSGSGWLSVTAPGSGISDGAQSPEVVVNASAAALSAGDYYGQIEIASADAPNAPMVVPVVMSVSGGVPAPVLSTAGLVFVGRSGGAVPAAQVVTLTNVSSQHIAFALISSFPTAAHWFTSDNTVGTLPSGQSQDVAIQAATTGLSAGAYTAELTFQFAQGTSTGHVQLVLVVLPPQALSADRQIREAAGCAPSKLLPVFTSPGTGFIATAGFPAPIEMLVVDDCGDPLEKGTVTVSFSSNDAALELIALGKGRWSGTWRGQDQRAPSVVVQAAAESVSPRLAGATQISGTLNANTATPIISSGGAVSAANYAAAVPLAPGSLVSIFGSNLGSFLPSLELPLPTELADTQVALGGRKLPLLFTSPNQINAIIPYDVPALTTQQLIIRRGAALSVPEPVQIAAAQPAVFTKDASGAGAGIVVIVRADGAVAEKAHAGDFLVIYGMGLGAVAPAVAAGQAAPGEPLARTTNEVAVTVGGKSAPVDFSGLAPNFAGLYQVNSRVPADAAAGESVEVVLTVAGQVSKPVFISIE